jgi:hypothetical protein
MPIAEQELRALVAEGMSVQSIARHLHCADTRVSAAMKQWGIAPNGTNGRMQRDREARQQRDQKIRELVAQGFHSDEIGERIGLMRASVSSELKRLGLKILAPRRKLGTSPEYLAKHAEREKRSRKRRETYSRASVISSCCRVCGRSIELTLPPARIQRGEMGQADADNVRAWMGTNAVCSCGMAMPIWWLIDVTDVRAAYRLNETMPVRSADGLSLA